VDAKSSIKRGLVDALLGKLETELATMRKAAKDAREAATHEEAKPENDKDTRALEASYLAGAQAARVRELEGAIKAISSMPILALEGKAIQASAIVILEDEDEGKTTFFVAPFGGGTTLPLADEGTSAGLQVVTPQSPLGRALLGRMQGDVIELRGNDLRGKGPLREMTIVEVW
jgi:transcription elongation GreA/GreB family factor